MKSHKLPWTHPIKNPNKNLIKVLSNPVKAPRISQNVPKFLANPPQSHAAKPFRRIFSKASVAMRRCSASSASSKPRHGLGRHGECMAPGWGKDLKRSPDLTRIKREKVGLNIWEKQCWEENSSPTFFPTSVLNVLDWSCETNFGDITGKKGVNGESLALFYLQSSWNMPNPNKGMELYGI